MAFSDSFFDRVEKKTNVDKDTILGLAKKLQQNDLKNEGTLRDVIQTLSKMTGKDVSKEQEDNNKIPKTKEINFLFLFIFPPRKLNYNT